MAKRTLFFLVLFVFHSPWVLAADQEVSSYARAMAAYNERNLDAALRYAQDAVAEQPENVDAYVLLGQLYYLWQDLARAKESWEKARELSPSRKDVQQALERLSREISVEKDLARSDTHPFIIRFSDGDIPVEIGSVQDALRDAYRQIGQQFDYFPDHPIPVLLYPEADFQKVKGLSHQVAGLYDGKIRLPVGPGRLNGSQLQAVLWHEYTHALVHDLARDRCPMWLNEGLAVSQESRVETIDVSPVRTALEKGQLPTWDHLWSEQRYDQASQVLYYRTSFLIVQYLVKRWSWQDMTQLLKRLGQGYPIQDALRAQYRTDPAVLEKEWRAWLNRSL